MRVRCSHMTAIAMVGEGVSGTHTARSIWKTIVGLLRDLSARATVSRNPMGTATSITP